MSAARPILIGMTSNVLGLGSAALAAAFVARAFGADFFFFKPDDVDPASETIKGMFYRNGRWEPRKTPFPDVVDNHFTKPLESEAWEALVRRCRITTPFLGGKLALDERMRASGRFDDILIPTVKAESPEHLVEELARFQRIVVKPEFGAQGRGIIYAAADDAGFLVKADDGEKRLELAEVKAFFAGRLAEESHIVQEYVASRTALGQPFDLRIHLRRDGKAAWQLVHTYVRTGTGTTIATNVALGGAAGLPKPFLEHRFGEAAAQVQQRLNDVTRRFPVDIQALFPGRVIPALGLDIGLDERGTPRLFEVNSNPSPRFAPFSDYLWRVEYALYLAKNPAALDGVIRR